MMGVETLNAKLDDISVAIGGLQAMADRSADDNVRILDSLAVITKELALTPPRFTDIEARLIYVEALAPTVKMLHETHLYRMGAMATLSSICGLVAGGVVPLLIHFFSK